MIKRYEKDSGQQDIMTAIEEYYEFNQSTTTPIVSVIVTTFNHAAFIAECLDSIFSQQTKFPFHVLIGDDCSTDGTFEICKEIISQYKIATTLVKWKNNSKWLINGKPTGRNNFLNLYRLSRTEYFAKIDGDDFWMDNLKLEKQLQILGSESYVMSFGQSKYGPDASKAQCSLDTHAYGEIELEDVRWSNPVGLMSSTAMWFDPQKTKTINLLTKELSAAPALDRSLVITMLRTGKRAHLSREIWGFYRIHPHGMWTGKSTTQQMIDNLISIRVYESQFQKNPKTKQTEQYHSDAINRLAVGALVNHPLQILSSLSLRIFLSIILKGLGHFLMKHLRLK